MTAAFPIPRYAISTLIVPAVALHETEERFRAITEHFTGIKIDLRYQYMEPLIVQIDIDKLRCTVRSVHNVAAMPVANTEESRPRRKTGVYEFLIQEQARQIIVRSFRLLPPVHKEAQDIAGYRHNRSARHDVETFDFVLIAQWQCYTQNRRINNQR